jgi:hypothetical protein
VDGLWDAEKMVIQAEKAINIFNKAFLGDVAFDIILVVMHAKAKISPHCKAAKLLLISHYMMQLHYDRYTGIYLF